MRRGILGLTLALLAAAAPAFAGEEQGWVVGVGTSLAFPDFKDTGPLDFERSSTSALQLGYRIHPLWSIEAQYERIRDYGARLGTASVEVGGWYAGVAAKFYPLQTRLRPYAMLGAGYLQADTDVKSGGLTFSDEERALTGVVGAGLELNVGENWAVELEGTYKRPGSDLRDLRQYTLGAYLRYRF